MSIPFIGSRREFEAWRGSFSNFTLVTLGAELHDGHLALYSHAAAAGLPTLLVLLDGAELGEDGANEAEAAGIAAIFDPEELPAIRREDEPLTEPLCGQSRRPVLEAFRFEMGGVLRLLRPTIAYHGEKNWQEMLILRKLAEDFGTGTKVMVAPTVRAPDGLALSARNAGLSERDRRSAPRLFRTLTRIAAEVAAGRTADDAIAHNRERLAESGMPDIEYIEARDGLTLGPLADLREGRVFGAARLGGVRLVDCVPLPTEQP